MNKTTVRSFIFVFITAIIIGVYSNQIILSVSLLFYYFSGSILVKLWLKNRASQEVYTTFFAIYTILLIITQYLFIDGYDLGYFNHNDSVNSFYNVAVMQVGPTKWNDFLQNTIMKSFYNDYPLFALWINFWKLVGFDIGVDIENLRLFLRLQNLLFAPGLLAIMAKYFDEIGLQYRKNITYCSLFGLFTYLFLTSVVFTRDLHVAFFYTMAGYYCLSPKKHKYIYAKFLVIALICLGLRPENGMFAIIFPMYYMYKNTKPSLTIVFGGVLLISIIFGLGILDIFLENRDGYAYRTSLVSSGGLYSIFNSLPFPLNVIFNSVYSIIMPFPISMYISDERISWLGITSILMPIINIIMIRTVFVYLKSHRKDYKVLYYYVIIIVFIVMSCNIEPNVRRTFAIIPTLYMLFSLIKREIAIVTYKNIISSTIVLLIILNIPAVIYLIIKG